jgi:hypothetical protein
LKEQLSDEETRRLGREQDKSSKYIPLNILSERQMWNAQTLNRKSYLALETWFYIASSWQYFFLISKQKFIEISVRRP